MRTTFTQNAEHLNQNKVMIRLSNGHFVLYNVAEMINRRISDNRGNVSQKRSRNRANLKHPLVNPMERPARLFIRLVK